LRIVASFEDTVLPLLGDGVEYVGEVGGIGSSTSSQRPAACSARSPRPNHLGWFEALAAGTPVAATPCGSAPEIFGHGVTGYVAAGEAALAEAVRRARDLDRSRLLRGSRRTARPERMVADPPRAARPRGGVVARRRSRVKMGS
jgi:glycosyltransferase involved in cell wall biosynthesis